MVNVNGLTYDAGGTDVDISSAPILKGSGKHDADFNVRNIMITGGAGFMYVMHPLSNPRRGI
jgi:hypothetical protein